MKDLFVSHSPVTNVVKGSSVKGDIILGRWRKSVKDKNGMGGKIFANAFGDTKEEAQMNAEIISSIPELIKALEYISSWESYKQHPIGMAASEALKKLPTKPITHL